MSFDEQPDGDIHGECAEEIHRLQAQVEKQSAALKLAREALLTICGAYPSSKTLEALAAIDNLLKGE